ncbi:hypothetical protein Sme01_27100 [Sphaerisporangium melleum]|uniref:XRE family transcriptional regulator n=1 Tax=Sphaerisporangium melleum TaxID=321316 RepID=A0A917QW87_9ACTN|nr:hypothetical protein [Sphaerisporangium melleum]GGK71016.1 hypothetical protein GCM10007964_12240 [Sphaerisporangium melleum]GII70234.1 hypothetical protein Sme01_27100 [Sphaerisporangium melleum]
MEHTRRCAKDIAARLAGSPPHDIAAEIIRCCGVHAVKAYRLAHGWTVNEALQELERSSRAAGLPNRGTDERTWRRWESTGRADNDYQDRLSRLFHTNPVTLGFTIDHSPVGGENTNRRDVLRWSVAAIISPVAADAEHIARELTRESERTDIGSSTLDGLRHAISDYGRNYSCYSAEELWRSAAADRWRVVDLTQRRMTLRQRKELYVTAGWLSVVLAWAAHDQGADQVALAYTADARHHAMEADCAEVVAWARDAEATMYFYSGRPHEALYAAQHGMAFAPSGSAAQVRLTGQLTRIYARLGRAMPAEQALTELRRHADHQPEHASGLFSADAVRIAAISATSHLWLGHDQQAKADAERAVNVYKRLSPYASPTRQAITLLDLATACARLGDPDEAVVHGSAAVSAKRHAAAIITRARVMQGVLERTYPRSSATELFKQKIMEIEGAD